MPYSDPKRDYLISGIKRAKFRGNPEIIFLIFVNRASASLGGPKRANPMRLSGGSDP
jgi:hypothetical protein